MTPYDAVDSITTAASALFYHLPLLWLFGVVHSLLAIWAILHALLFKRDPRAALGWISVCLLFPLAGPLMYYLFGINRIQTEARRLRGKRRLSFRVGYERGIYPITEHTVSQLPKSWQPYAEVSDRITGKPLLPGNHIALLENGEAAYPAMLEAIDKAQRSIYLLTYLFQHDEIGERFIAALINAHQRGVKVYVLIDGFGALYTFPSSGKKLRKHGISVSWFLPPRLLPPSLSMNLRNHRKVLVIDETHGFTGGMNISQHHYRDSGSKHATEDLHFAVSGPVIQDLCSEFYRDWTFSSDTSLTLANPPLSSSGDFLCRCLSDGPSEDLDRIALSIRGMIATAKHSITLITPYFLPQREMIATLQAAALKGVSIEILLPEKSNLRFVDWATRSLLWELLHYGIKVYYQPNIFAHTKLIIVDDCYVQLGSANLDPRSLRLNFELNLEVLSPAFCRQALEYAENKRQQSRPVTLSEIESRPLNQRIRDAFFWLFSPYL